jgi:hypothetical protein
MDVLGVCFGLRFQIGKDSGILSNLVAPDCGSFINLIFISQDKTKAENVTEEYLEGCFTAMISKRFSFFKN